MKKGFINPVPKRLPWKIEKQLLKSEMRELERLLCDVPYGDEEIRNALLIRLAEVYYRINLMPWQRKCIINSEA